MDTKMVKGDLTIPSLALTKGAVAVKALRQGGYPGADHNTLGSMVIPMFLGEYPKGISFLFKN